MDTLSSDIQSKIASGGLSEVERLAEIITSSVAAIIKTYRDAGETLPSLSSTDEGAFDAPSKMTPELFRSVQLVEAACAQLCAAVAPPTRVLGYKKSLYHEPACLRVALGLGVADILQTAPQGMALETLAQKCNMDASDLGRVMRRLCVSHIFQEVAPDVFANNRLSIHMASSNPFSPVLEISTAMDMPLGCRLYDSVQYNKGKPREEKRTPFELQHGQPLFTYIQTPEARDLADLFSKAMVGQGYITDKAALGKAYPWSTLSSDTVVCDVGAGVGHVMMELLRMHPHLKAVVQDMPHVMKQGELLWERSYPEAIQSGRARLVPINFLKEKPVEGCSHYYIRHCIHNWSDDDCVAILSNIRSSMTPKSRLLIHEAVLQYCAHVPESEAKIPQAPEPLLANFGSGNLPLYNLDIAMMNLLHGKERTFAQFVDLCVRANLTFVNLWSSNGDTSLLEFEPNDG